jgi:hypothetical protein
MPEQKTIRELFPEDSRLLLTGGGKEFIERIGVEAAKQVVLSVMQGENIRTQTEPLSRRRIAQVSGAIVALFANGLLQQEDFTEKLSALALQQINASRKNDNASIWPAQWLLGLTGKSVQNVLRSNPAAREAYIADFEEAVAEAAAKCRTEMGDLQMTLGYLQDQEGRKAALNWQGITRLTTAIGSATLTIRGSDKSIYGKLFERLILGSILSIMGFERVNPLTNTKTEKVFWLSDSSDLRESDATLLLSPGKLARFDIGFIGPGNSEISKDKLSRYAREIERDGIIHNSVTFIVVDRLPKTGKTEQAAKNIEAEIIQMSWQRWPKLLAQRVEDRLGYTHELSNIPNDQMSKYLEQKLAPVAIQDFLIGVSPADLQADAEIETEELD